MLEDNYFLCNNIMTMRTKSGLYVLKNRFINVKTPESLITDSFRYRSAEVTDGPRPYFYKRDNGNMSALLSKIDNFRSALVNAPSSTTVLRKDIESFGDVLYNKSDKEYIEKYMVKTDISSEMPYFGFYKEDDVDNGSSAENPFEQSPESDDEFDPDSYEEEDDDEIDYEYDEEEDKEVVTTNLKKKKGKKEKDDDDITLTDLKKMNIPSESKKEEEEEEYGSSSDSEYSSYSSSSSSSDLVLDSELNFSDSSVESLYSKGYGIFDWKPPSGWDEVRDTIEKEMGAVPNGKYPWGGINTSSAYHSPTVRELRSNLYAKMKKVLAFLAEAIVDKEEGGNVFMEPLIGPSLLHNSGIHIRSWNSDEQVKDRITISGFINLGKRDLPFSCLLYTSPSPRDRG